MQPAIADVSKYACSVSCRVQYLHAIAQAAQECQCGRAVMFYLAAAVSDFYIPWSSLVSNWMLCLHGGTYAPISANIRLGLESWGINEGYLLCRCKANLEQ